MPASISWQQGWDHCSSFSRCSYQLHLKESLHFSIFDPPLDFPLPRLRFPFYVVPTLMVVLSDKLIMIRWTIPGSNFSSPAILPHTLKKAKIKSARTSNLFPGVSAFPPFEVETLHYFHPCYEFAAVRSNIRCDFALCFPRMFIGNIVVPTCKSRSHTY